MCVDVALPSGVSVAELLPDLLGLVDDRTGPAVWRLDRVAGEPLDGSLSLADNGVRDGELLVLSPDRTPFLGVVVVEPCQEVAAARPSTPRVRDILSAAPCLLLTALAALGLASTAGSPGALTALVVAAVGALVSVAATVATGSTATALTAAALAGATGYLAVPSAPSAPNAFLAATATLSAAVLLWRWSGRDDPALMATVATAFPVLAATVTPMPGPAVGAVLSTTALVVLILAPRITLLAGGRGTPSHHVLDGLVAGAVIAGAAGTVVVAMTGSGAPALAFTAVLAASLALLGRTHVDPPRRIVSCSGGLVAAVSSLWIVCDARPSMVSVAAAVLIVAGLATTRSWTIGAAAGRVLDRLTCAALVAAVPAACWVAGVGELVGRFHLP